ncbi:MAG: hypothetical protein GIKADHBN_00439 [Phycisphaerales bacterium]|nr:hypothetical protein [Phycisphaerales bacterium]
MKDDPQIPDPLLTPDDVARLLGVSVNTLNAWRVQRRHLAFVSVGRLVRYRASDVQQFINSRVRKAGKVGTA